MSYQQAGFIVFDYPSVSSTQLIIKDHINQYGLVQPICVTAQEQTEGRGRYDRVWESYEGNLFCTLAIPVNKLPFSNLGIAPLFSSLTIIKKLTTLSDSFALKWPNDILLNDKKLCGILLETYKATSNEHALLIGIGINILHFPHNTLYPATSLQDENIAISCDNLLCMLLEEFSHTLNNSYTNHAIINDWKHYAKGIGEEITVHLPDKTVKGRFKTLNAQGNIIIEHNGTEETISAGDLFFLDE